ncbi:uncharacterized protein F5891DRAFT_979665 [Suillus fuscotomentosus]|uniref:Uncharacterized protein n=1 Tax=Suillus fuscotomentosus TaxID=1912939 RepID=A0AAD4E7P4_9AGAM|nr:uncharacterized protein F5891DRAFT_979665 [Suillus fuscotomentosus]KAG1901100.1 hypothetical protein F5891DRAFT_979665 [Suillus fuscotomentosus]
MGSGFRNGSGKSNQNWTVWEDLEPRTVFWSSSGWHENHGPNHGEPDQKSGLNHGSGPDHGSTNCQSIMIFDSSQGTIRSEGNFRAHSASTEDLKSAIVQPNLTPSQSRADWDDLTATITTVIPRAESPRLAPTDKQELRTLAEASDDSGYRQKGSQVLLKVRIECRASSSSRTKVSR